MRDEATAAQRKLLASSSGFGWHTVVYCIARASRGATRNFNAFTAKDHVARTFGNTQCRFLNDKNFNNSVIVWLGGKVFVFNLKLSASISFAATILCVRNMFYVLCVLFVFFLLSAQFFSSPGWRQSGQRLW